jgi:RNA polymerase sigma-70 factor (ECF subfamily)
MRIPVRRHKTPPGVIPTTRAYAEHPCRKVAVVSLPGRDSLSEADDRTIASRAADGDIRAFEVLMRRYGSLMTAYAARIVRPSEAEDVVQDTFVTAWQDLPDLENVAAVRSWLITIVTRKSIDRLRARRDQDSIDDHEVEDRSDGPEAAATATSLDEALSRVLSTLPEDQRRCWVLREIAGYGYQEIAEQLDLPVSTVRGLLVRSRKTLIREMEAWR